MDAGLNRFDPATCARLVVKIGSSLLVDGSDRASIAA